MSGSLNELQLVTEQYPVMLDDDTAAGPPSASFLCLQERLAAAEVAAANSGNSTPAVTPSQSQQRLQEGLAVGTQHYNVSVAEAEARRKRRHDRDDAEEARLAEQVTHQKQVVNHARQRKLQESLDDELVFPNTRCHHSISDWPGTT